MRNEIKSKQTKDKILNAALNLFSKNGFEATSIRDISKEANISLGLLYNYYVSKNELLKEIFNKSFEQIKSSFEIIDSDDPIKNFDLYLSNTFEIVKKNKEFWKLMHSIRVSENVINILKSEYEEISLFIINKLESHINKIKFSSPLNPMFLFAMIDGVISHYLILENYPIQEMKTNILDYIKSKK
ncbi:MAG: TetR/AcrR family transcriptional regulator [Candidatus Kapabacteria bacterium]|nr:TetR/AcrR family transcriptional regulator [Candidatus Kapabacteria bacterium]